MICSSFYHSYFVFFCQTQERFGNSYVVVQIAERIEYAIFLSKDSTGEFLCGSLTICPRHLQYRCPQLMAVVRGQLLHCCQNIINKNHAIIISHHFFIVNHSKGAAFFEGHSCKFITIESFSFQRKEDCPFRTLARIRRNDRMLAEQFVQVCCIHFFHSKYRANLQVFFRSLLLFRQIPYLYGALAVKKEIDTSMVSGI